VISCGFVLGISFIVRQRKKTRSPMKTIGAQVMILSWTSYQLIASTLMREVCPPGKARD
jgi:hypothetical protein